MLWKHLREFINNNNIKKLDVGCGHKKIPGAISIDVSSCKPDYIHDLNQFPYPFETSSFDYIHCSHIIEHLNDTMRALEEIHRIAKNDGYIYVCVPHFSSRIAYADPTHVRYFALTTFTHYFKEGYYMHPNVKFEVVNYNISFSKMYWLLLVPLLANIMPRFYEDHFAFIFPAKFIHVLLKVKK